MSERKVPFSSPEARLLFLSAGGTENDEGIRRLLTPELNWVTLLALAQREKAELVLWRRLRAVGWSAESEEERALQRIARVWEFKMGRLEGLLHNTLSHFRAAGIEAVLLKGAGTAYTAFRGFADRPMFDADLLVRAEQAEEAWELARTLDWHWDEETYPAQAYASAHHLPPLDDVSGSNVGLDLHTTLWLPGYPFRFDAEDIWGSVREVTVEGVEGPLLVPSTSHQLLYACLHMSWAHRLDKYAWQGFREIGAVSRQEGMSWNAIVRSAKECRAQEFTYWPLRLGVTACGLEIPEEALRELGPGVPTFVTDLLERHFLSNISQVDSPCPSRALAKGLWRVAMGTSAERGRVSLPRDQEPVPLLPRLGGQLRALPSWARYLSSLVKRPKAP